MFKQRISFSTAVLIITRWFAVAGVVCIGAMMMLTVVDVAGRAILSQPVKAGLALISTFMVGVVFFGLAYCYMVGGHIKVELLTSHLSPRMRGIFEFVMLLAVMVLMTLFTYTTTIRAIYAWEIKEYYWRMEVEENSVIN